jgi:2-isopropylmalate synthase
LPKELQREFGPIANVEVDRLGREVSGAELKEMFWREYIERNSPWQLHAFETQSHNGTVHCHARLLKNSESVEVKGQGNGPLAALVHGFITAGVPRFEIEHYSEHALSAGEEAAAIAYIQIKHGNGRKKWGAGSRHQHRVGLDQSSHQRFESIMILNGDSYKKDPCLT